jgi:hypothetical protein
MILACSRNSGDNCPDKPSLLRLGVETGKQLREAAKTDSKKGEGNTLALILLASGTGTALVLRGGGGAPGFLET